MLAAGTACTIEIDSQVIVLYFNIDVFAKFRDAVDRSETCMSSALGIERAYTDKAMHAYLTG
jgi:hypothetical protein